MTNPAPSPGQTNKWVATHEGQTFERPPGRAYTHVVLARPSYRFEIDEATAPAKKVLDIKDHALMVRESDPVTRMWTHSSGTLKLYAETAHLSANEYAEKMLQQRIDAVDAKGTAGDFDRFVVVGWCGNEALASRKAKQSMRKPWFEDVTIATILSI